MANNLDAHQEFLNVWQQALESERGIRVKTNNPADYRARLYYARTAERRQNKKIFPDDHPMHGKSYYDQLVVKLEEGAVRIEKHDQLTAEIEAL